MIKKKLLDFFYLYYNPDSNIILKQDCSIKFKTPFWAEGHSQWNYLVVPLYSAICFRPVRMPLYFFSSEKYEMELSNNENILKLVASSCTCIIKSIKCSGKVWVLKEHTVKGILHISHCKTFSLIKVVLKWEDFFQLKVPNYLDKITSFRLGF